MGNSGWTADPEDLTIPPDGAPPDDFIYIGSNDPLLGPAHSTGGIVFHFGTNYGFVLGINSINADTAFLFLTAVNGDTSSDIHVLDITYDAVFPSLDLTLGDDTLDLTTKSNVTLMNADQFIRFQPDDYAEFADCDVKYRTGLVTHSMPRGFAMSDLNPAVTAFAGPAESVHWTTVSATYRANRAYEIQFAAAVAVDTANAFVFLRIRKTNLAGQILSEWARVPCPTINDAYKHGGPGMFVVGSSDVTCTIAVTLFCSAGQCRLYGSLAGIGGASAITIKDVGAADDYTQNGAIPIPELV